MHGARAQRNLDIDFLCPIYRFPRSQKLRLLLLRSTQIKQTQDAGWPTRYHEDLGGNSLCGIRCREEWSRLDKVRCYASTEAECR